MSKSVDGVVIAMKILLEDPMKMAKTDHTIAPITWNENSFGQKEKLKIGWYC